MSRNEPAGETHLEVTVTVHDELCERLGIEFPIVAFTHWAVERVQLVDG